MQTPSKSILGPFIHPGQLCCTLPASLATLSSSSARPPSFPEVTHSPSRCMPALVTFDPTCLNVISVLFQSQRNMPPEAQTSALQFTFHLAAVAVLDCMLSISSEHSSAVWDGLHAGHAPLGHPGAGHDVGELPAAQSQVAAAAGVPALLQEHPPPPVNPLLCSCPRNCSPVACRTLAPGCWLATTAH